MKSVQFKVLLLGLALSGVVQAADTSSMVLGPNATISFDTGKASLTKDSKTKLNELVKHARASGKINEVQVAAWSDNPVPREGEELSKSDGNLAGNRAKNIANYLKSRYQVSDVDSYNMAERANWLARTFDTADAELKTEIVRGGPMSKNEFQVFKENGKASKAVVLTLLNP